MAYVEIRKGGKLVKRHLVDDAKARKGCRIRVGSAGQVRLSIGQSKKAGKYEIAMFEGIPSDYGPQDAGEAAQPTASFLPMSETGEMAFTGTPGAGQAGKRPAFPKIEGFEITGQLGRGGMGIVWCGVQLSTKRKVAIKFLGRHRFDSKRSRARFEREVSLAARLTHPNIARVYHSGLHRGIYYYAMEFIDGVHLDKFVKQNDLSQREILELMKGVCDAICHAHEQGVIHRDLKPSNILVTKDGRPHIVDFGLAKASVKEDEDLTISIEGEVAGTLAYMAPEQAAGRLDQISERTDVYSLGVIMYELLTARLPHDLSGSRYDTIKSIVEEDVTIPRESDQSIDLELEALMLTALAREPENRYPSAGVLLQDITNYLNGEPLLARSLSRTYLIRKRIGKHRKSMAIALGFAVVLFAVIGIAMYYVNAERQKRIEFEQRIAGQPGQQQQASTTVEGLEKGGADSSISSGGKAISSTVPGTSALPPPPAGDGNIYLEEGGFVCVEAEHYDSQEKTDVRQWCLISNLGALGIEPDSDDSHTKGASGGAYLEALPDTRVSDRDPLIEGQNFSTTPGQLCIVKYKVWIENPGRYYVWARAHQTNAEDNACHVGIDGTWPNSGARMQWCSSGFWQWRSAQRTLAQHCGVDGQIWLDVDSAGLHTIEFSMREDGFELDKWFMTTMAGYPRPDGIGPSESSISGKAHGTTPPSSPAGWVNLFNGTDLIGWKMLGGKAKYEVRSGAIVGTTVKGVKNSFLCTEKSFSDFELEFEVQVDPRLNSGVQFRSNSLKDYKDYRVHGYQVEIDPSPRAFSGHIFDEARRAKWLYNPGNEPKATTAFKNGQWNKFRVLCLGDSIKTWINGTPIANLNDSMTRTGFIGLQIHKFDELPAAKVSWRNIRIKVLDQKTDGPALSPGETQRSGKPPISQGGWINLFNGEDLTGWEGNIKGHRVRNGILISDPANGRETLCTVREFGDFILRFEFKLVRGANNGLAIRTPLGAQASVHGMEIQIIDNSSPKHSRIKPEQSHGSIYGLVPAKRGYLKPVGQWNTQEVTAKGRRITVRLNGTTILDVDIDKAIPPEKFEGHPGLKRRKGRIGFCPHTERVEFRNIQIKTLD